MHKEQWMSVAYLCLICFLCLCLFVPVSDCLCLCLSFSVFYLSGLSVEFVRGRGERSHLLFLSSHPVAPFIPIYWKPRELLLIHNCCTGQRQCLALYKIRLYILQRYLLLMHMFVPTILISRVCTYSFNNNTLSELFKIMSLFLQSTYRK